MKKQKDLSQLHLVTEEESSSAAQQQIDILVGQGMRKYKELQQQMDRALFSDPQDIETLAEVMPQLQVLRQRLANYGVHVRP